ncbi:MAG: hypothetical protein ABUS51_04475 [Acidobacteriota bacterium]
MIDAGKIRLYAAFANSNNNGVSDVVGLRVMLRRALIMRRSEEYRMNIRSLTTGLIYGATLLVILTHGAKAASLSIERNGKYAIDDSRRVPKWSEYGIITVGKGYSPTVLIFVLDEDGNERRRSVLPITGAAKVSVLDYSLASDGSVALCGSAGDSGGRVTTFLAIMDAGGADARIVATSPYWPQRVVFASDGTVWVSGYVHGKPADSNVFRHFDRHGELLGELMPQENFTSAVDVQLGATLLTSNAGRIGWLNSDSLQYIEFTDDGKLSRIHPPAAPGSLARQVTGAALDSDGRLLISTLPVPRKYPNDFCLYSLPAGAADFTPFGCDKAGTIVLGARGATFVGRQGDSLIRLVPGN